MTREVTIEIETKQRVTVTIAKLAEIFCAMSDEEQAQFFIECTKITETWPTMGDSQWWYVGKHLGACRCSSPEAREMIRTMIDGIKYGEEHPEPIHITEIR